MSYTLRGRVESRLAAVLLPFLAACAAALGLGAWWPLELAGAMIGAGLALDVALYHRLLPWQPTWAAIPLGLIELTATMALVRLFDIAAPLEPALWFFVLSWALTQVLGQAGWPLARLTYAEDGGELGRGGVALVVLAPTALLIVLGTAWATRPPIVHLSSGVHQGPIVITSSQVLDGEPGTIVRGGIVIRADDVTVRDVAVIGGEYGIEVDGADGVQLERVSVSGAELDGIHARRSSLTVRDCTIDSLGNRWAQGIDISFSNDKHPSRVTGCTVTGGLEGIVTHFTMARIDHNRVSRTSLRAISMTEMSMGEIHDNEVWDALGIGIFCNDMSMCDVDDNVVVATHPDRTSGDRARVGYGVLASYHAEVELGDNELDHEPGAGGSGRRRPRLPEVMRRDALTAPQASAPGAHRAPGLPRPAMGAAARGVGIRSTRPRRPWYRAPRRTLRRLRWRGLRAEGTARRARATRVPPSSRARGRRDAGRRRRRGGDAG